MGRNSGQRARKTDAISACSAGGKVIAAAGEAVLYTSSDFAYDSAGHGIEHPGHSAGITLEVGATVEGTAALAMQRSNVARVYGGYDIACVLRCFHRKLRY